MISARILVVGHSGQVAGALRTLSPKVGLIVETAGRPVFDVCDREQVNALVTKGSWSAVVNAAAHTQVDQAESEPELAFATNTHGPAALADACAIVGIPLLHLSTDYVFDGTKAGPYLEDDPVNPLSIYGASKADGEHAIRARLAEHVILRTSWVFSSSGHNFVRTMLRLFDREELRIIDDQYGRPTAAMDIAAAISQIVSALLGGKSDGFGTFHFAGEGTTTWFDFAREIFRQADLRGLPRVPRLSPIQSTRFTTLRHCAREILCLGRKNSLASMDSPHALGRTRSQTQWMR